MKIEQRNPRELKHYKLNAKQHPEAQVKGIVESIKRFGFIQPVVVDKNDEIIIGHGRTMAAMQAGLEEVPTVKLENLTEQEVKALRLIDNRIAETGWDADLLKIDLENLDIDLKPFAVDFSAMMPEPEKEVVEDDGGQEATNELTMKWGVELGQVWQLGEHRVMCGDSTKEEDVAKLMNGNKADLCFTSPPYALSSSVSLSGNKAMSKKGNAYNNYKDDAGNWDQLMREWFLASNAAVSIAWVVNIQPLAGNKRELMRFVADNCERLVDIATWDKGHAAPAMAAGVMASRYEWIVIFAATNGASRAVPLSTWRGTIQNLYDGPPQRNNKFSQIHAATMPLHLPSWVMQTLCDQSKSVYEPFCGTGTTLIAAEQLSRKCYGMEISPDYVAVILQRWADFTGKTPELAEV